MIVYNYVHVHGFVAQESLYIQECMMYETGLEHAMTEMQTVGNVLKKATTGCIKKSSAICSGLLS